MGLGPNQQFLEVSTAATEAQAAAAAATLDSDSLRKIPREKFRTEINTPRARGIVRVGGRGVHGFGGV